MGTYRCIDPGSDEDMPEFDGFNDNNDKCPVGYKYNSEQQLCDGIFI